MRVLLGTHLGRDLLGISFLEWRLRGLRTVLSRPHLDSPPTPATGRNTSLSMEKDSSTTSGRVSAWPGADHPWPAPLHHTGAPAPTGKHGCLAHTTCSPEAQCMFPSLGTSPLRQRPTRQVCTQSTSLRLLCTRAAERAAAGSGPGGHRVWMTLLRSNVPRRKGGCGDEPAAPW